MAKHRKASGWTGKHRRTSVAATPVWKQAGFKWPGRSIGLRG